MQKKEVEKNEEGLFKKWLDSTDTAVGAWNAAASPPQAGPAPTEAADSQPERMPHAPTSFERNLEVWRQLWRVTEISQVLLVLLDARCPLLHFPPALAAYLAAPPHGSRTRVVLVLTKVDIAGPARAAAWTAHLRSRHPHLRVVQVESYAVKHGPGGRPAYEPHLPSAFRAALVDALREAHAELLEPPERVRNVPERLAAWRPPVRREVDWDAVLHAQGGKVGTAVGGAAVPRPKEGEPAVPTEADAAAEDPEDTDNVEPEYLTIGLIGQPNVGKSSLLNALFGIPKVRASKTPGKTKHFQTLFWTPEVRLVDCPGLVIPNLVPMETQVLSGILPISRVSAVPLCIHHAAQLLPLERILALTHPASGAAPADDKRTWREPRTAAQQQQQQQQQPVWTAMDVLTAYALKKGWLTAKAGRPDVNRAGNYILRMLAEGRIRWAFWPPGTPADTVAAHQDAPGAGIWIAHASADDAAAALDISDSEDEAPERAGAAAAAGSSGEDSEDEALGVLSDERSADESDDGSHAERSFAPAPAAAQSRFAVLNLGGGDDDDSDDSEGGDDGTADVLT